MDNQEVKNEGVFCAGSATEILKQIEDTTREYLKEQAENALDLWWQGIRGELLSKLNEGVTIQLNSAPNMHSVQVQVVFKGWK